MNYCQHATNSNFALWTFLFFFPLNIFTPWWIESWDAESGYGWLCTHMYSNTCIPCTWIQFTYTCFYAYAHTYVYTFFFLLYLPQTLWGIKIYILIYSKSDCSCPVNFKYLLDVDFENLFLFMFFIGWFCWYCGAISGRY